MTDLPKPDAIFEEALSFLSPLVADAHDKSKAKYVLAVMAVTRLATGGAFSRKKLILSHKSFGKEGREIQPVSAQVDWLRSFLDRMIRQDLIQRRMDGSTNVFLAIDTKPLEVLVRDAIAGGVGIKRLLWPNDYPVEDGGSFEDELPETDDEEDEGLNLIQDLTAQLITVASHLENIYGKLTVLETQMTTNVTALSDLRPIFEQGLDQFSKKLDSRLVLQALSERVVDQQSRRRSLINQLSADASREEKVLAELSAVLGKVDP